MNFDTSRIILLAGKKNSGKTNVIKHLLYENRKIFNFGLVFTRTKFDNEYKFIPDEYIIQGFEKDIFLKYLDDLEKYKEAQENQDHLSDTETNSSENENGPTSLSPSDDSSDHEFKLPGNFLVFDDLVGILKDDNDFINFICNSRHYNCSVFLSVQYLKKGCPSSLRECVDYAVMFNTKTQLSLEGLWENFGQLFKNYKEFGAVLIKATSQKFHALLYDANKDTIEEAYQSYVAPDVSKKKFKFEY